MICLNWAGGPEQGNKMPLGVPVCIRVSVWPNDSGKPYCYQFHWT